MTSSNLMPVVLWSGDDAKHASASCQWYIKLMEMFSVFFILVKYFIQIKPNCCSTSWSPMRHSNKPVAHYLIGAVRLIRKKKEYPLINTKQNNFFSPVDYVSSEMLKDVLGCIKILFILISHNKIIFFYSVVTLRCWKLSAMIFSILDFTIKSFFIKSNYTFSS